jgi:alkylation response protein AidB-like acyl-CoA dehydrogenase
VIATSTARSAASEQDGLRATARAFFAKHSDEPAVRSAMTTTDGYDPDLWRLMADQLGLQALLIPSTYGGADFRFVDVQVVVEEMGRALVCAPYLSSAVLAVYALLASGDADRCAELLPRIADGTRIAALAFTDAGGRWEATTDEVHARNGGNGWTLKGRRRFVLDGAVADTILVAATTPAGPSLFAVDAAAGLHATPLTTLDMTRRQADLTFDDADALLIGQAGAADGYLCRAFDAGLAALAAEQVGGARRALEMSVEYAKVRHQFGRPIGSFQAIKHKCADMLMRVECAATAAHAVGEAIDENSAETAALASLAKAYCSEAYCGVAAENIQVHGGIGFTWEHAAHLYFRRAKSSQMLFGNATFHRQRLLKELGL